ncbi:hypothetical protein ElyMa_002626600 [Elysia marginata]|uniref:Transmembrane protein n=1 Tax=Elysia marginata TaxID=1093978 RepID=A0AAV4H532_9GAST|nr:hypothetical protein ElyMa_002626600 [Elysia marginata]
MARRTGKRHQILIYRLPLLIDRGDSCCRYSLPFYARFQVPSPRRVLSYSLVVVVTVVVVVVVVVVTVVVEVIVVVEVVVIVVVVVVVVVV